MSAGSSEALWAHHHAELRDPAQIASQWDEAAALDPRLLRARADDGFWEVLERLDVTLLVTREYEHLVMGLTVRDGAPHETFQRLPHPSGLAVDPRSGTVHVAATRNPNQIVELAPVMAVRASGEAAEEPVPDRPLLPVRSRFLPGRLYLHDLAFIGRRLHANAVGENAVVALHEDGRWERVWWPRSIEGPDGPDFALNHLQLNSIAAGTSPARSFYSASAAAPGRRRPGHLDFPVDGTGVIFSGATREPVAGGLTRPHSARLRPDGLWVDNSGYGEVGRVADGRFEAVAALPGWTRGLCSAGEVLFVGTSRVLPRFHRYAPGLDVERSMCAVHALDPVSGTVLGSLRWPAGNQIFAIEAVPRQASLGLAFPVGSGRRAGALRRLFSGFVLADPTSPSSQRKEA
jgi:uncharacterized protein (TIGR03032 family)